MPEQPADTAHDYAPKGKSDLVFENLVDEVLSDWSGALSDPRMQDSPMLLKALGQLAAAQETITALVAALEAVEWMGYRFYDRDDYAEGVCPECESKPHDLDCPLAAGIARGKVAQ